MLVFILTLDQELKDGSPHGKLHQSVAGLIPDWLSGFNRYIQTSVDE